MRSKRVGGFMWCGFKNSPVVIPRGIPDASHPTTLFSNEENDRGNNLSLIAHI